MTEEVKPKKKRGRPRKKPVEETPVVEEKKEPALNDLKEKMQFEGSLDEAIKKTEKAAENLEQHFMRLASLAAEDVSASGKGFTSSTLKRLIACSVFYPFRHASTDDLTETAKVTLDLITKAKDVYVELARYARQLDFLKRQKADLEKKEETNE